MKKVFSSLFVAGLLLSSNAFADTVQTLNGKGIDGEACSVRIVRDGNTLKSVTLSGASKVFEILSDSGGSTGPRTHISPRGGQDIFSMTENGNSGVFNYFTHSENLFSNGEVFKFDTSELPKDGKDGMGGIKMIIQLGLDYDGEELVSVKAQSKAKALVIATIASSQFTCEKQ